MSSPIKHPYFSSVLSRIVFSLEDTPRSIATSMGYKNAIFVEAWMAGRSLPPLSRVCDLAAALGWPFDELLIAWLADAAPEHLDRFKIIGAQLIGLPAAENVLSCAPAEDGPDWLTMLERPMTSMEVASKLKEVPRGGYRDNRGGPKS